MLIFVHVVYCYTGKMIIGAWLMYVGTPIYNYFMLYDSHNIDPKYEKVFMNSKMFLIPLWTYVIAQGMSWVYCLILFSDGSYQSDHWIFENKPQNAVQYILLAFVLGFFQALAGTAGHELVHQKDWINKFVGNLPYIECMYSHFWEEHVQGHHKNIATPLDPVCHDINVSFYTAIPKAIIGTHTTTWDRNMEKIRKENDGKDPTLLQIMTKNNMMLYMYWNLILAYATYRFFGYSGLMF